MLVTSESFANPLLNAYYRADSARWHKNLERGSQTRGSPH
jgi:hypothetical protein